MQFAIDRQVVSYIITELGKNPQVEEGGKHIGYLLEAGDPALMVLGLEANTPAMVVTDFLPSGPNAIRTAVELQPDGEYQERLFRRLEQMDSAIEHVGTWHSHHCNGLQTLSPGDISGYFRTVNKRQYRPNYFLASLVTRLPQGPEDRGWLDHYVFVRDDGDYYKINDRIKYVDAPSRFGLLTGHAIDSADRIPQITTPSESTPGSSISGIWHESAYGRSVLADDKRFFSAHFEEVKASRRLQRITLTGRIGPASVSITYPCDEAAREVAVTLRKDDTTIFDVKTNLQWRRLAISAVLTAVKEVA